MAIAVFYAFGTLVGAGAPPLFGAIVDTGAPSQLFAGYALASALMIGAAVVARVLGVDAERRSLEPDVVRRYAAGVGRLENIIAHNAAAAGRRRRRSPAP